jgi:hypothetical protein
MIGACSIAGCRLRTNRHTPGTGVRGRRPDEINPDHLPDLELLHDFCETLAAALT